MEGGRKSRSECVDGNEVVVFDSRSLLAVLLQKQLRKTCLLLVHSFISSFVSETASDCAMKSLSLFSLT